MLEVHARLHKMREEAKRKGEARPSDPLPIIAANFVKDEGRLLCLDEFQVG